MDNHYHLLVETPDPNLSLWMRPLNGVYTQRFNRCHNRVGHVFQGRYKSIVVEKNEHLLELCRYLVLNPVRASMAEEPKNWSWSNYQAIAYSQKVPDFLTVEWILGQFGKERNMARRYYGKFVADGISGAEENPWKKLVGQIVFGGSDFVADIQSNSVRPEKLVKYHGSRNF